MTRQETREKLDALNFEALVREIVSHLDGWDFEEPAEEDRRVNGSVWYVRMHRADSPEYRATFSLSTYPPQVNVSGYWPTAEAFSSGTFVPEERPRASFSPFRPAEKLAKEVERRFCVPYLAAFSRAAAKRDAAVQKMKDSEKLMLRLAAILGVECIPSLYNDRWHLYIPDGGTLDVTRWGSVTWELGYDEGQEEQCRALARLIASQRGEDAGPPEALRVEPETDEPARLYDIIEAVEPETDDPARLYDIIEPES